jgi:hypothetical protein
METKKKFTLVIRPDGRAILACEEGLSDEDSYNLGNAFRAWREKTNDILVLGNTTIITVIDIGLELPQGMKS